MLILRLRRQHQAGGAKPPFPCSRRPRRRISCNGIFLIMPQFAVYATNQLLLGNPYRRYVYSKTDKYHILRDTRLSGTNAYKQIGLEGLPDDDDK